VPDTEFGTDRAELLGTANLPRRCAADVANSWGAARVDPFAAGYSPNLSPFGRVTNLFTHTAEELTGWHCKPPAT
jgi:hypothetical protein